MVQFPTKGFKVVPVKRGDSEFTIIDFPGTDTEGNGSRSQYQGTQGIIYVVDIVNKDKIVEAGKEISQLLKEEDLQGTSMLVLLNKVDVESESNLTVQNVLEKLGVQKELEANEYVLAVLCSTKTNQGIEEGFTWLTSKLQAQ
eukprot:TRINITY_DN8489_c0_g1_i2.p1 TRINITY_DN8489_c0_g1~~TRINITY_DN8489_c0_g1_i2.p1  ORF type:complete len:143 (-),score=30.26 TRINITY_DN8489_c0_g1_i2:430-858(-)